MITKAHIQHYKSIADASLFFRPTNVIVGPNGSGKSNILDSLYFLHDCVTNDVDTAITIRHGIDSLRQWSRKRPYHIIIDLQFKNEEGSGTYRVVISSNKGNFRISRGVLARGLDDLHFIDLQEIDKVSRYQLVLSA